MSRMVDDRHDEIMALYKQGLSDRRMADIIGTSAYVICGWRRKHNLDANWPPNRRNRENKRIEIERMERKKNMEAIKADDREAKALGLSYGQYMARRRNNE